MPEISVFKRLVRVVGISADGSVIYIRTRNDESGHITGVVGASIEVGDVIDVREVDGVTELVKVDPAVWPFESRVGTVLHVGTDHLVVEIDLRPTLLPGTSTLDLKPGNTVEIAGESVRRVLSPRDLSRRSGQSLGEDLAGRFRRDATGSDLTFESFGGSADIVRQVRDLVEVSLAKRAELEAIGARPIRGVLFAGPPGTGKTHLARIIARESGAAFFEISGPQVFSKWFGESEETVRQVFAAASEQPASIIFFDEIDSVGAKRSDESHEASKRVVGQLLTELDGFTATPNVLVVAATNRPHDLDEALLRPGRFDRQVIFTLPDFDNRVAVLRTSGTTYKHLCDAQVERVASLTEGWSPAELSGIWVEAAHIAVGDGRAVISPEDLIAGVELAEAGRIRKLNHAGGSNGLG
jgi:transitional endoplasmic reticulum ATPase